MINETLQNDMVNIVTMSPKSISKGEIGKYSIEVNEGDDVISSYVYKSKEDRDADLTELLDSIL